MSYVDPSGMLFEDTFAKFLTPKQQGILAGTLALFGGYLVNAGIGSSATGVGILPGAITTGLGAYFIYEGGVNGYKALQRSMQTELNNFDQAGLNGSGGRSPASINAAQSAGLITPVSINTDMQNRRQSCPVKP